MEHKELMKIIRQTKYYMKPCQQRNELFFEASNAEDINC